MPFSFETSWGTIQAQIEDGCVQSCDLPDVGDDHKRELFQWKASRITGRSADATCARDFNNYLAALFSGKDAPLPSFMFPAGPLFHRAVWRALLQMPCGTVATYGELATRIGRPRAARAVGQACGANPLPLIIPCHRVVGQNHLGGFSSGLAWKTLLLEVESMASAK